MTAKTKSGSVTLWCALDDRVHESKKLELTIKFKIEQDTTRIWCYKEVDSQTGEFVPLNNGGGFLCITKDKIGTPPDELLVFIQATGGRTNEPKNATNSTITS